MGANIDRLESCQDQLGILERWKNYACEFEMPELFPFPCRNRASNRDWHRHQEKEKECSHMAGPACRLAGSSSTGSHWARLRGRDQQLRHVARKLSKSRRTQSQMDIFG